MISCENDVTSSEAFLKTLHWFWGNLIDFDSFVMTKAARANRIDVCNSIKSKSKEKSSLQACIDRLQRKVKSIAVSNVIKTRQIQRPLTISRSMTERTAYLRFHWFELHQISKIVIHSSLVKQLNPKKISRSAIHWHFPLSKFSLVEIF